MERRRPIIGPLKVDEIHSGGKGIGIWNEKKYFIPFVIPEEIIIAQTENRRLGFRTARIYEIIKESPKRVLPICTYFGLCGGCNFMHIDYNHQLLLKKQILQKAFEKYKILFKLDEEFEPALMNKNYRNKATYKLKYNCQTVLIGFHPAWDCKNIVDIEYCYLLQPSVNKAYKTIRRELKNFYTNTKDTSILAFTIRCNNKGNCQIIFEISNKYNENTIQFISSLKEHFESIGIHYFIRTDYRNKNYKIVNINQTEPFLYESLLNQNFRISPFTFFQNNVEITEKMLQYINKMIDFNKINILYDLYSGNGAISISLINNKSISLFAIESNLYAVNDAVYNSQGKSNHIHIHGDVLETFNQNFINESPKPDIIILDPPRSGTLIEIQKNIINAEPKIIVYVSCNPVSLAWNLQQLTLRYKITHVKTFDMFPQTHQFETVVILERIKTFV